MFAGSFVGGVILDSVETYTMFCWRNYFGNIFSTKTSLTDRKVPGLVTTFFWLLGIARVWRSYLIGWNLFILDQLISILCSGTKFQLQVACETLWWAREIFGSLEACCLRKILQFLIFLSLICRRRNAISLTAVWFGWILVVEGSTILTEAVNCLSLDRIVYVFMVRMERTWLTISL